MALCVSGKIKKADFIRSTLSDACKMRLDLARIVRYLLPKIYLTFYVVSPPAPMEKFNSKIRSILDHQIMWLKQSRSTCVGSIVVVH